MPSLQRFQEFNRNSARRGKAEKKYVVLADLLNYKIDHAMPAALEDFDDYKMYVVHHIVDAVTATPAVALVTKQMVQWIGQLADLKHAWALHGDATHKLHYAKYIFIAFGSHHLQWDAQYKVYRHSFIPLVVLFTEGGECA